MGRILGLALLAVVTMAGPAWAGPIIGLDYVVVVNGTPVFEDHFDDGVFSQPPWSILSGSPGPETGTTLEMHAGDTILAGIGGLDPALDTMAQAGLNLTSFPSESSASLFLLGDEPGELLALVLIPTGAFAFDSVAGILGSAALTVGSTSVLELTVGANGVVSAVADGTTVFSGPLSFGPVAGVGISVLPEPSALALLGAGVIALARRRSTSRRS